MAKHAKSKKKKTPKKKHSSKVKKLAAINAKSLSKAQKRHLKDYGELHPVDLRSLDRKNVKIIEDTEVNGRADLKFDSKLSQPKQEFDSGDDESAYQKLIGSLGTNTSQPFFKHLREEEEDMHEECVSEEDFIANGDDFDMETNDVTNKHDSGEDNSNQKEIQINHGGVDKVNYDSKPSNNDESDDDYRMPSDDLESDDEDTHINSNMNAECQDPFNAHFEQDLDDSVLTKLAERSYFKNSTSLVPSLGTVTVSQPTLNMPVSENLPCQPLFKVKEKLCKAWADFNGTSEIFSPVQRDLFGYINKYQDVLFTNRNFDNGEEIRRLYCLHAVNHVLKTRSRVLKNNAKIGVAQKENKEIEDLRDQGLTRPKVLILAPFRDSALKVVNSIIGLLINDGKGQVMNKKRFLEEYSDSDVQESKRSFRPVDFEKMFSGNIDDCFRIGLSIKKNSIKVFSPFYSSDIIVASPLGLRTVIGTEGEKFGDFDFLSSIEVLIVDQVDVFLMQNWEHVQHVFDHLHKQPKSSHDVDFSRVRNWCLNGWSKYYRQTLLFSNFVSPEQNSLFNKYCHNFAGKIKAQMTNLPGSICQAVTQVPQVFHQIQCSSFSEAPERCFEYFTNKILPEFSGEGSLHTAMFIPSYFDFVRLRNHFRKEEISFTHISEYSKRADITRARNWFKDGTKQFLLYTERFYFYYRYRIKGIRNIIFYGLPHYAHFYPEILNFLDSGHESAALTSTALYTKYDNHRLADIVGSRRCSHMMSSKKQVHMFVAGEKS